MIHRGLKHSMWCVWRSGVSHRAKCVSHPAELEHFLHCSVAPGFFKAQELFSAAPLHCSWAPSLCRGTCAQGPRWDGLSHLRQGGDATDSVSPRPNGRAMGKSGLEDELRYLWPRSRVTTCSTEQVLAVGWTTTFIWRSPLDALLHFSRRSCAVFWWPYSHLCSSFIVRLPGSFIHSLWGLGRCPLRGPLLTGFWAHPVGMLSSFPATTGT